MNILWLDYESRSRCDLPSKGAYNYAMDPSTSILCMGYAFNDDEPEVWVPGKPFPAHVADHFAYGGQIRAHNAAFDRLITEYVLCNDFKVPAPKLEQWYCTAAQSRANCAPSSLADVGRFAGAGMKKDHRGSQLIRLLSLPQSDGTFNDDPELLAEMYAYCAQDIRAMREISQAMRQLSEEELADYHVNERINDKGVLIDRALARAATHYAGNELDEIQELVREITEGEVQTVRSPKMRDWVLARVGPEGKRLMTVYKGGEKKFSVDKTVRKNMLAIADEQPWEVPPHVADVLQCADDVFASSVSKFKRMDEIADIEDDHVRGVFIFNGGGATGRYSSLSLQLHNFTRMCAKEPEPIRKAMVNREEIVPIYGHRVTDILKEMLRPALMAPEGQSIVSLDWAGIEARVLPWLSNDPAAEATLELFRQGKDLYVHTASLMFKVPESEVTVNQRLLGKIAVLACGFASGPATFEMMAKIYGVRLTEAECQKMVNLWRRANPWAVPFWQKLEKAAYRAMRNPYSEFAAGKIVYMYDEQHLWYALPSNRILCYPYAKLEDGQITYAKAAYKPRADATEWPRSTLWRGLQAGNCTQSTANDLLRNSLRIMDVESIDVRAHIHDQILVYGDDDMADPIKKRMIEIMTTPPEWAEGLPLAVDGTITKRFGK